MKKMNRRDVEKFAHKFLIFSEKRDFNNPIPEPLLSELKYFCLWLSCEMESAKPSKLAREVAASFGITPKSARRVMRGENKRHPSSVEA